MARTRPPQNHAQPDPSGSPRLSRRTGAQDDGYDEWLERELAAGEAELDAGQGRPAAELWRSLGLE